MKKNKNNTRCQKSQSKPWKYNSGRRIPTDKLRAIAQAWDHDTWNDYLQAQDGRLWVELVDNFDDVLSKYAQDQAERAGLDEVERARREKLFERLDSAIEKLPASERALIQAVYWDNLSLREFAKIAKHDRKTVRRLHKKAISLLREIIGASDPVNRGVAISDEKTDPESEKDNDIKEVYAELTGIQP